MSRVLIKKQVSPTPYKEYLNPKHVYLPLIINGDTDITALAKKEDMVEEGELVAKSKGNWRVFINASIGGKVTGFSEKYYLNNQKLKCLVIENDFVDQIGEKSEKKLTDYTKEQALKKMQDMGIVGLSGSGFPTAVKYDNQLDTLIVNAVESDPDASNDAYLILNKCEEILEITDALVEIFGMKEAIIAVKKTDVELKKHLNYYLGTYIKLKLAEVPNTYTAGWEKELVQRVKKINCKTFPTNKKIVVNGVATMYALYEALKYNQALTSRIVTFSGPMLKENANVLVKIGTPVSEIIEFLGGYLEGDKMLIANGPLMGNSIASDDLVVSSDLTSVRVVPAIAESIPKVCMRCGECVNACPVKLSPVLINEATENFEQFNPDRCIGCGLCSYICPSQINLRKKVEQAKGEIK